MLKKIKRCLEASKYEFKEFESVTLSSGWKLSKGFKMHSILKNIDIHICLIQNPLYNKDEICIFDITNCRLICSISDPVTYKALFKLGMIIEELIGC